MDRRCSETVRARFGNEVKIYKYPIGNMEVERYDTNKINKSIEHDELFNNDKRNLFLVCAEGRIAIAKTEFNREKKTDVVFMSPATTKDEKNEVLDEGCDETKHLYFFKREKKNDYNYNLTKTVEMILRNYKEYIFDVLKILRVENENGSRIYLRLSKKLSSIKLKNEKDTGTRKRKTFLFTKCYRLLFFLSLLFYQGDPYIFVRKRL